MPSLESQLDSYLRARFPLIVLTTVEEERALQTIKTLCEKSKREPICWDMVDGFTSMNGAGRAVDQKDPVMALEEMAKIEGSALFVLKDFHDCWETPAVKRKLRNILPRLRLTKKSLIVVTGKSSVPEELRDDAVLLDFPAPRVDELGAALEKLVQAPGVSVNLTENGREQLVQAALGLTVAQAQRVFAKVIVNGGGIADKDIAVVLEEKKQIIRESEALEFYAPAESMDDVGGLDVLKHWLRQREKALTKEARAYGIPPPKGIALVGIPGTGKSLAAKMMGSYWRLPLLRLDVGALFGSYVGESEERTRKALRTAETVAPCIVWIDEMEKALAQGGGDGGTGTRVFGNILTWMQEKTAPCFVIATANDITKLPPELLRRGRFDEIFFMDLPNSTERQEIFKVHLRKRQRDPSKFDLTQLSAASTGYVGAEIEQALIDAMYLGFNDGGREFNTQDVIVSIQRQVPMSVSARESITALRRMLTEGRAQSASLPETK